MSNIQLWTPIQEGRFHYRSMARGESIPSYLKRMYPDKGRRDEVRRRISSRIQMARREAGKLNKKASA